MMSQPLAHARRATAWLVGNAALALWRLDWWLWPFHERTPASGVNAGQSAARSDAARWLAEFHDHPNALAETTNTQGLRVTLHREEHRELIHELEQAAVGNADLGQIARELADVVYVAYGSAWAFGIDLDAALREVHRAAMDKMNAGVRRADGKILKPPGFEPPDMSEAVARASAEPYDGDPLPSADDVRGMLADRGEADA